MRTFFTWIWPDRTEMSTKWHLADIKAYRRHAIIIGLLIAMIGAMVGHVLIRQPYGDILTLIWLTPVLCLTSLAYACARRADGILLEIRVATAPLVEMLRAMPASDRNIVLTNMPPADANLPSPPAPS